MSARIGRPVEVEPGELDCRTCGACCTPAEDWPTYVYVSPEDRARFSPLYRLRVVDDELATVPRPGGIRCIALGGAVGARVRCRIHPRRPDACRDFTQGSPWCLDARREILGR